MSHKTLASAALLALSGLAHGLGSANVVNQCDYDVYVTNVPASTSGLSQVGPMVLSSGDNYSQEYTELSGAGGWSIKMAKDSSLDQVLQYEYSYGGTDIIYFDLSAINGDPWNGNYFLSGSNGCDTKQTAYTYPSDDLAAMQACSSDSSVTLTLCPSGNNGGNDAGNKSDNSGNAPPAPPAARSPTTLVTSVVRAATATPAASS